MIIHRGSQISLAMHAICCAPTVAICILIYTIPDHDWRVSHTFLFSGSEFGSGAGSECGSCSLTSDRTSTDLGMVTCFA